MMFNTAPATAKQRKYMRDLGIEIPGFVSKHRAMRLISNAVDGKEQAEPEQVELPVHWKMRKGRMRSVDEILPEVLEKMLWLAAKRSGISTGWIMTYSTCRHTMKDFGSDRLSKMLDD